MSKPAQGASMGTGVGRYFANIGTGRIFTVKSGGDSRALLARSEHSSG
jgi:hypothetical protein